MLRNQVFFVYKPPFGDVISLRNTLSNLLFCNGGQKTKLHHGLEFLGLAPSESWEFYGFLSLLFPFGLAIFRSGLAQRRNTMVILASPFIYLVIGENYCKCFT
jgi:hypothetical protein